MGFAIGDRVRFKLPDRSVRKGVVTAIHRGGEKVSVREEATDEVHRLPAVAQQLNRQSRLRVNPDLLDPHASRRFDRRIVAVDRRQVGAVHLEEVERAERLRRKAERILFRNTTPSAVVSLW